MAAYPSPPPPSALPALNFVTVISEARRIINAHSRHFLALSVLFLLPVSFSFAVYPALTSPNSATDPNTAAQSFLRLHQSDTKTVSPVLLIYYTAFVFLFSLSATSSITHSTIQGFYGRPVRFLPAIKSIFTSFFTLCATAFCTQLIIAPIIAILGLLIFLAIRSVELVHRQVDYSSPYFLGFFALIVLVFWLIMLHLQVQWALVNVTVVAESVWGFQALKRSSYLVKGMKKIPLSLVLLSGLLLGTLITANSVMSNFSSSSEWKTWAFVIQIVLVTSSITIIMLLSLAANVVLYMYCKAIHGELAMEIAQEFARDYVSLPFDNGKVPHVVTVAYT
ncbi:hypothetical protein SAY86_019613 [Trapa natans]|uniref:Uncharacterized protein n=1 Tax=Trapa natans TaxID=22666 RepID=A0AAN7LP82_TRANT|nr:hypothetical protein SAY86_019613 [Trapa natans]